MIDDVVGTWISLNHMDGVLGHKRNGMSIALDDTEDRFVTRAAKNIWDDVGMSKLRDDAVSEVRSQFLDGRLTWTRECVDGLRVAFPDNDAGCHIEGQEIDGELDDGERPWCDGDAQSSEEDDDDDDDDGLGPGGFGCVGPVAPVDVAVVAAPGDTADQLAEAQHLAKRLKTLEDLRAQAETAGTLPIMWHVNREIQRLEKSHRNPSASASCSAVLQRFLRSKRLAEQAAFLSARAEAMKKKKLLAAIKLALKKKKLAAVAAKAKAKAKTEALAALPRTFTKEDLGFGHPTGGTAKNLANRVALLKRLRLRSPALPPDLAASFDDWVARYSDWMALEWKHRVGLVLQNVVKKVIDDLGKYFALDDGTDRSKKKGPGQDDAFVLFIRSTMKRLPPKPVDPHSIIV